VEGAVLVWRGLALLEGAGLCAEGVVPRGEYVMAVEIKSVVSQHDVDEHLERLERVRKEMNKRKDHRKLVGTVAGMVVEEKARSAGQGTVCAGAVGEFG
jgi:hypothetical protein